MDKNRILQELENMQLSDISTQSGDSGFSDVLSGGDDISNIPISGLKNNSSIGDIANKLNSLNPETLAADISIDLLKSIGLFEILKSLSIDEKSFRALITAIIEKQREIVDEDDTSDNKDDKKVVKKTTDCPSGVDKYDICTFNSRFSRSAFEEFKQQQQSVESGGRCNATNELGAYGLHQVMWDNWIVWTKELLGIDLMEKIRTQLGQKKYEEFKRYYDYRVQSGLHYKKLVNLSVDNVINGNINEKAVAILSKLDSVKSCNFQRQLADAKYLYYWDEHGDWALVALEWYSGLSSLDSPRAKSGSKIHNYVRRAMSMLYKLTDGANQNNAFDKNSNIHNNLIKRNELNQLVSVANYLDDKQMFRKADILDKLLKIAIS